MNHKTRISIIFRTTDGTHFGIYKDMYILSIKSSFLSLEGLDGISFEYVSGTDITQVKNDGSLFRIEQYTCSEQLIDSETKSQILQYADSNGWSFIDRMEPEQVARVKRGRDTDNLM